MKRVKNLKCVYLSRGRHDTIVVGRQEVSRIKQIFGGGTTDHVLRDAKGIAVWVMG